MSEGLTTNQLKLKLREQYPIQAYGLLFEVPNGTGGNHSRWADALAMSLWPSRGLELIGMELKVSRGDWLKELKHPEKADEVCRFCHRWYVVAGAKGIVKPDELPKTWGLIEWNGNQLKTTVKAPELKPVPVTTEFLAGLFRRATEQSMDTQAIEEVRKQARLEAAQQIDEINKKHNIRQQNRDISVLQGELDFYKRTIAAFEQATGVSIGSMSYHQRQLAKAVVYLAEHKLPEDSLRTAREELQRALDTLAVIDECMSAKEKVEAAS